MKIKLTNILLLISIPLLIILYIYYISYYDKLYKRECLRNAIYLFEKVNIYEEECRKGLRRNINTRVDLFSLHSAGIINSILKCPEGCIYTMKYNPAWSTVEAQIILTCPIHGIYDSLKFKYFGFQKSKK